MACANGGRGGWRTIGALSASAWLLVPRSQRLLGTMASIPIREKGRGARDRHLWPEQPARKISRLAQRPKSHSLCQDRKARGPTLRNMPRALGFACDEEKQHILDLRLAPNDVTRPSARLPETPQGDCHCCSKLSHGISKNISLLVSFRRPVGRGSLCVILTPAPSQG